MELGGFHRKYITEISCLGFSKKLRIPILVNIGQNNTFCIKTHILPLLLWIIIASCVLCEVRAEVEEIVGNVNVMVEHYQL
jgi:hypothetical protein